MAGRGRIPKKTSQRPRDAKRRERGDWTPAPGVGWQHGPIPKPPDGLQKASRDAWKTWMGSWFAAHWTSDDLPGLRQVVRIYDLVERGEAQRIGELRQWLDTFGISPKGQQDRRWTRPIDEKPKAQKKTGRYGHLRPVNE